MHRIARQDWARYHRRPRHRAIVVRAALAAVPRPAGSGVADSQPLPIHWDAASGRGIVWKTPVPGIGHSSPVVWGDRVFITTAISSATQRALQPQGRRDRSVEGRRRSRMARAGARQEHRAQLWSQTAHRGVPKVKRHVKATQANATPVTDGRFVVVSFGSEGLYTYDMNGTLLWKQDLGILDPGYAGQPDLQWGFATLADHLWRSRHPAVRHPEELVHRRVQC